MRQPVGILAVVLFGGAAFAEGMTSPTPDTPAPDANAIAITSTQSSDRLEALDRRITVLENKSPPAWYMAALFALIPTAFGAALGYAITTRLTQRAEGRSDKLRRVDSAIAVAAEWIQRSPKMSHINYCLENPSELYEVENRNAVLEFGNWMEVTAHRISHELVDRDLLVKMGILKRMEVFLQNYNIAAAALEKADRPLDIRKHAAAWTALAEQVAQQKGPSNVRAS